jgi:outer membrane protein assembly factor BamB
MHLRLPAVGLLALLALPPSIPAAVPQWPQFRGPNGAGVAHEQKPPVQFGPETNLLWKVSVPRGHSSPCIWGDRIFLTGYSTTKLDVICLQRKDGRELWRKSFEPEAFETFHDKDGNPAASTPATDGQRVFVYFGSVGLICYDFEGKELWRRPLPVASMAGFGTGTSPIVAEGLVLLNRDQTTNSQLLAVQATTGKTVWAADRRDYFAGYSTPIIWEHDSIKEVVLPGFLRVKAYQLKDGADRWLVRGLPAAVCPTPVLGDGLLFVAAWANGAAENPFPPYELLLAGADRNGDGVLSRIEVVRANMKDFFELVDANQDRQITRAEWDQVQSTAAKGQNALLAIKPGGTGDLTDSNLVWKATKGLPYVASPLFYQGRIYLVKDGGLVSCFEAKSGKPLIEQERLNATGAYYSSPVAANGHVYFASVRGIVTVLAAGDTLKVVAQNDVDERLYATPALVDDTLYLRTTRSLCAFKTGAKPAPSP